MRHNPRRKRSHINVENFGVRDRLFKSLCISLSLSSIYTDINTSYERKASNGSVPLLTNDTSLWMWRRRAAVCSGVLQNSLPLRFVCKNECLVAWAGNGKLVGSVLSGLPLSLHSEWKKAVLWVLLLVGTVQIVVGCSRWGWSIFFLAKTMHQFFVPCLVLFTCPNLPGILWLVWNDSHVECLKCCVRFFGWVLNRFFF